MSGCTYEADCTKGCGTCSTCGLSLHYTTGGDRIMTCGCGFSDWRPAALVSLSSTLHHVKALQEKVDALTHARDEAIAQLAHRAAVAEALGDLDLIWHVSCICHVQGILRARNGAAGRGELDHLWPGAAAVMARDNAEALRMMEELALEDCVWSGPWPFDASAPELWVPVVYVLFCQNEPVYVGSTHRLPRRLREHSRTKTFDFWTAYVCETRDAAFELEDRLLKERFPKLNKRRGA